MTITLYQRWGGVGDVGSTLRQLWIMISILGQRPSEHGTSKQCWFNSDSVRGSTLDVGLCQIVTSKVDPRTEGVNYL